MQSARQQSTGPAAITQAPPPSRDVTPTSLNYVTHCLHSPRPLNPGRDWSVDVGGRVPTLTR